MPTTINRHAFNEALRSENQDQIRMFLQQDDVKDFLLTKDYYGYLPIHFVCSIVDSTSPQLILDTAVKHGIAKQMLEEKEKCGRTCLHLACRYNSTVDCLRLLLEYLSKHADIKKVLEAKDNDDQNCLHAACDCDLSSDLIRLLISFFRPKNLLATMLDARDYKSQTPTDRGSYQIKRLLQESDCFEQCRLWLLRNHQDTFFYSLFPYSLEKTLLRNHEDTFLCSLYPNSFDQTCQALKELPKNALQYSQQQSTIMLIALMPSPSKFREAVNKTYSSAPMSSYLSIVKKGDKQSDYNHWRKNIHLFREFWGQFPPSERKTASTYEKDASAHAKDASAHAKDAVSTNEKDASSCSCSIQ